MNNIGRNSFDIGYLDTLASGDSLLHRLDPRAKLIATLAFIVAVVSFDRYAVSALAPFFLYPAVLISVGGLPAGYIFRKALTVLPFAILVGMFNPVLDREIIFNIGPFGISGGWVSFLSIILRSILTVTAALVLVASTGFNAVCDSFSKFGVPRFFVSQLSFFYRYIFVLTDETERMVRARSFRALGEGAMNAGTFTSLAGHLLLRTLDRAERVYCAMRCRGFDGNVHIMRKLKFGYGDIFFAAGWTALFIFMRNYNISLEIERIVTGFR